MDIVIGFILIAAIIGVFVLWQQFTGAVRTKVTQTVLLPKSHQAGKDLVGRTHRFLVSAPKDTVYQAVLREVSALPEQPVMPAAPYLEKSSDSWIAYRFGRKLYQAGFRVIIAFAENGNRTEVSYRVSDWSEDHGIVNHQKEIQQLNGTIERAILRVYPSARADAK